MSTTDPHHEEHADGIVEDREKTPPVYFSILFYGLIVWGVAFMAFYLFSGWSSAVEFKEKMAAHKGEPVVQEQTEAPQAAAKPAPQPTTPAPSAVATAASDGDKTIDAKALFVSNCAGCHGPEGKGAFGPDLSADYKYGKNSMAVQESISYGRPRNMPAFEQKLSSDEIKALADFVLSL